MYAFKDENDNDIDIHAIEIRARALRAEAMSNWMAMFGAWLRGLVSRPTKAAHGA